IDRAWLEPTALIFFGREVDEGDSFSAFHPGIVVLDSMEAVRPFIGILGYSHQPRWPEIIQRNLKRFELGPDHGYRVFAPVRELDALSGLGKRNRRLSMDVNASGKSDHQEPRANSFHSRDR
ncbi:MAG TPA: hypothetical protein VF794_40605, partial [Archangium sp.]|uniref:hypothetical protein n=1 Tax=Archangium sp. TaxID=1872627 RepID=UPI002EDA5D23